MDSRLLFGFALSVIPVLLVGGWMIAILVMIRGLRADFKEMSFAMSLGTSNATAKRGEDEYESEKNNA